MKRTALGLLLALTFSGAYAQTTAPARPKAAKSKALASRQTELPAIDALLREYTTANRVPGASALIMRDGKVIYRKAFGLDDVAAKTPLREDAILRIASQTKAIVSAGVMMLYDEGKFQLDDPISKYLPAFRTPKVLATFNPADSSYTTVPAKSEITIRQLLTHTSGIGYPGIGSQEARAIYAKAHIPSGIGTPGGKLRTSMDALGQLPLMHQPGEKFSYGLSIDVLGYLIEVLSGQPLDQFLRARLFEPLAMRDTYFFLPKEKQPRLAVLYTEDASKNTLKALNPFAAMGNINLEYPKLAGTYFSGGAGLSSTLDDYAAFLLMMLNEGQYNGKRLLKPATVRLMTSNQIGEVNQGLNKFGLGFSIVTTRGAAQSGLSEGSFEWGGIFGTTYWVDPKEKIVALLYTQKYPNSYGDLADKFKHLVRETVIESKAAQIK
ncbi:beta-lactamase family protein [Hymenobacter taeanensis]|uniref:Beta-lactamase family protein n=1 Tax=Hymenobacter taeanensis TaxID=2735321 RepID=A0A6M6BCK0_9BACT|nr:MULTISPECIES: serine hydrolase domain-containing protein [Hymenobacter]QJX45729.1 beta-lactamase family protein [Hymenobacter taeanensis]UOQ79570.1 beta-lactamase family protein [Hymenobacter sp. 5414T-23]